MFRRQSVSCLRAGCPSPLPLTSMTPPRKLFPPLARNKCIYAYTHHYYSIHNKPIELWPESPWHKQTEPYTLHSHTHMPFSSACWTTATHSTSLLESLGILSSFSRDNTVFETLFTGPNFSKGLKCEAVLGNLELTFLLSKSSHFYSSINNSCYIHCLTLSLFMESFLLLIISMDLYFQIKLK